VFPSSKTAPRLKKISPIEPQISGVQAAEGQPLGPVAKPMGNPNLNLAATVANSPHCLPEEPECWMVANLRWLAEELGCPQEFPG
jgi:hypothetical protein